MKKLLNVLYVLTEGSYLSKQGETICVHVGGEEKVRVPGHTIESIVCLGNTTVSSPLLAYCGERGIGLSFLNCYGKFYARLEGPVRGNVLLRRAQYLMAEDEVETSKLAYWFVAAKIANQRNVLQRAARESNEEDSKEALSKASDDLANIAKKLDVSLGVDSLRGLEGSAAATYFGVFDYMIKVNKEDFFFKERTRRPPLDNVNALLSFYYALLLHDTRSALESVGLDPAAGFLHAFRPGRPSLALDMMEELRSPLCDRLTLTLINRKQLQKNDFEDNITSVRLTEDAKKTILVEWQKRKNEEITHPYLNEKIPIGLIPHIQAQLLARFLRGDLDEYPPFYWK